MKLKKLTIALGTIACLLASAAAMAQSYPSKTIRFVVPFPPGNTIDTVARLFADAMASSLRQTIVVDNQAGASGMVGYTQAARAMPDGHTVIFGGSGLSSAPFIVKNPPVDYHKNFKPVALLAEVPLALVVSAKSSINSVSDLIAQAKQTPGRLSYAAPNTISQFASEQMKMLTGTSLKVVQYKASTQALTDVGNNEVSMFFVGLGTAKPYLDNGTVRAIGWTTDKRPDAMPSLPTVAETIPGFYTAAWIGVLVPAGTPDAIVERLNSEFLKALANGVADKLVVISINPRPLSAKEHGEYIERDIKSWGEVTKAAKWEAQ